MNKIKNYIYVMSRRLTKEQFIEKSRIFHGDIYDYSKTNYINDQTKVVIICNIHGEFNQSPGLHYRSGCITCGLSKRANSRKNKIEDLIIKFREKHFDKYDIIVENWAKFGLLIPSSIRVHKLATLDKKLFYKKLGSIDFEIEKQVKSLVSQLTDN